MKIRFDYVSNSSATSFVVKLHEPIDHYTKEEFRRFFKDTDIDVIDEIYDSLKSIQPEYSYKVNDYSLAMSLGDEENNNYIEPTYYW